MAAQGVATQGKAAPHNIRGILFDKDGTLLDYHRTWMPANRAAIGMLADGDTELCDRLLALGGWDAASGRVRSGSILAAADLREMAEIMAPHLPPDKGRDIAALERALDSAFMSTAEPAPVLDLPEFMGRLAARGMKLGVATADSAAGAERSLAPFGVMPRLDFIAGYDSGYGRKPGPGMVLGFCEACGLTPAETAVVGDNPHDIEMGRAAGAGLVIGVLTGTSGRDELSPIADHVLESIAELEACLW